MFRLAGFLKKSVGEIERTMSCRELAEWMAFVRHFKAFDDSWAETGLIVSAMLAPYSEKGKTPKATDFIPIEPPPQHNLQAREVVIELRKQLGLD